MRKNELLKQKIAEICNNNALPTKAERISVLLFLHFSELEMLCGNGCGESLELDKKLSFWYCIFRIYVL